MFIFGIEQNVNFDFYSRANLPLYCYSIQPDALKYPINAKDYHSLQLGTDFVMGEWIVPKLRLHAR